jgi:hypothetical protein
VAKILHRPSHHVVSLAPAPAAITIAIPVSIPVLRMHRGQHRSREHAGQQET